MKSENTELTLAIIKPDAAEKVEEIREIIKDEDIQILQEKSMTLNTDEATNFYAEKQNDTNFNQLMDYITSGPIVVLVLSGNDVINKWKKLLGPKNLIEAKAEDPSCLRAKYGTSELRNAFHGSDDELSATREIAIFFPKMEVETANGQEAKIYLEENVNPMLLKGLTELCRTKPEDPIVWLADWLLVNNNKNKWSSSPSTETGSVDE